MEDMESLLIPQISMDVDETPLNLEDNHPSNDDEKSELDLTHRENDSVRIKNLLEQENFDPAQTPEKLTDVEIEAKIRLFSQGHPSIEYVKTHCSSCNVHLGTAPINQDNRYIHPLLNVLLCKSCYEFYCSGEFEKDEDGSELYCRWCGQGGKVMCCSGCAYVFCQKCIRQNLGKRTLDLIIDSDDWYCFVCNPSQLINLRILCASLYEYVKNEIREVKQSNELDRLKKDYAMCCSNRSIQQRVPGVGGPPKKKRRANSPDISYDPNNDQIFSESNKKRSQLLKKALSSKPNLQLPPLQRLPMTNQGLPTGKSSLLPPPLQSMNPSAYSQIRYHTPNRQSGNPTNQLQRTKERRVYTQIQPRPQQIQLQQQLQPNPLSLNNNNNNNNTGKPILINTSTVRPITAQSLAVAPQRGSQNFIPPPPLENNLQTRIIQPVHNSRKVSSIPANFTAGGLKNSWFLQASSITQNIVGKLSSNLVVLTSEQRSATSVEQLAMVHNKLQELLSSSVNSLIQVRKNLRNEFLNDLNKMRFSSGAGKQKVRAVPVGKVPTTELVKIDDDDDVIIVNNDEDPLAIVNKTDGVVNNRNDGVVNNKNDEVAKKNDGVTNKNDGVANRNDGVAMRDDRVVRITKKDDRNTKIEEKEVKRSVGTSETKSAGFLKVKCLTELNQVPSECITIPDEPINEVTESKELPDDVEEVEEIVLDSDDKETTPEPTIEQLPKIVTGNIKEKVETPIESPEIVATPKIEETTKAAVELTSNKNPLLDLDKDTYWQIQRALSESKLEALIEENSKYKVDSAEICPDELARMLTVRILIAPDFSPLNLTTKKSPRLIELPACDDFEDMLQTNVVNSTQQPRFNEAFSKFVTGGSLEETELEEDNDENQVSDESENVEEVTEIVKEVEKDVIVVVASGGDNKEVQEEEEEETCDAEILEQEEVKERSLDDSFKSNEEVIMNECEDELGNSDVEGSEKVNINSNKESTESNEKCLEETVTMDSGIDGDSK